MNRLNCNTRFFLVISVICISAFAGDDGKGGDNANKRAGIEMFLCFDLSQQKDNGNVGNTGNESHVKMVYGYINGQRTECMSEADFLSRFCMPAVLPKPPSAVEASAPPASNPVIRSYAGANFREADLFGMDFRNANCRQADFFRADMRNINLQDADCKQANFEGAYLKNADLNGADLSDANLKNAYFVSADLRNVSGLTIEIVRFVATLHDCKLDADLCELVNEYCPSKWRDVSSCWGVPDDAKVRVRRARNEQ